MNSTTALLIILTLALTAVAQEDPNCEPEFFAPPDWADPNLVVGMILPARVYVGGAIDYNVPAGKFVRKSSDPNDPNQPVEIYDYCDPNGDRCIIGVDDPNWSITYNEETRTWTLAGEVVPGPNYVRCWIKDIRPVFVNPHTGETYDDSLITRHTVLIYGSEPVNHGPMLH